jgi:hypothetical protein
MFQLGTFLIQNFVWGTILEIIWCNDHIGMFTERTVIILSSRSIDLCFFLSRAKCLTCGCSSVAVYIGCIHSQIVRLCFKIYFFFPAVHHFPSYELLQLHYFAARAM